MSKNTKKILRRGTTLAETMVAVAITVAMLMITGIVFNSATTSSGKASASTEIMHHYRILSSQLESDLNGLRSDMPLALIFEEDVFDPDPFIIGDEFPVRTDRIVFYANGDFQTLEGISGSAARIFYGQSGDIYARRDDMLSPGRRILARRAQLFSAASWTLWPITTAAQFDYCPLSNFGGYVLGLNYWKQIPYDIALPRTDSYFDCFFREGEKFSFIRRPSILNMVYPDPLNPLPKNAAQRVFMLSDVTDFKIQIWYLDNLMGKWRWFPNQYDLENYNDVLYNYSGAAVGVGPFALAWNINIGAFPFVFDRTINGLANAPWISLPQGAILQGYNPQMMMIQNVLNTPLPRALKFTFTLYDQNRRRFPEGQTFSYIVQLPQ